MITDFSNGILIEDVNHTLIINNSLSSNSVGIFAHYGHNDHGTITNNKVTNNSVAGIRLSSASNNTISSNYITSNGRYGLDFWGAYNNNASSNYVCSNGIYADGVYDISSSEGYVNYGDYNTCNLTGNWSDSGAAKCRYICGAGTTTTSTTTSTTTTLANCALRGDQPPCGEVTLSEVISLINSWAQNQATLTDVIQLINAWALG